MKIAFSVNGDKPKAMAAATELAAAATALGLKVIEAGGGADCLIALGGDGTMLKAVRDYPAVPVLGFNLGGLGYLSSVGENDFKAALEMLAARRFHIAERTMVSAKLGGREMTALNDIVIQRALSGHVASLEFRVDGKAPTHYAGDGLVIATPTGSTAYSLAAGGPVVMPDSATLVVTPINPHTLAIRPLVVSDEVTLSVIPRVRPGALAEKIGVYADGVDFGFLEFNQELVIRKSTTIARLVELEGYDPYDVLARKLGWSGANQL